MNKKPPPGKAAEPSVEELEFIYSRVDKRSDSEILDEMQDEDFPLRTKGFIKRRRKEFAAAKKVLGALLEKEVDPIIAKKREEHFDRMANIAHELVTVFTCLEDVRGIDGEKYSVGEGEGKYQLTGAELAVCLQENLDKVRHNGPFVGTDDLAHDHDAWPDLDLEHLECHLRAELAGNLDCGSKGLQLLAKENPYELIEALRVLWRRKTFKGKCDVCRDW